MRKHDHEAKSLARLGTETGQGLLNQGVMWSWLGWRPVNRLELWRGPARDLPG